MRRVVGKLRLNGFFIKFVVTKKGTVDKDKFFLPKSKALRFDGDKVWFEVTKDEAKAYKQD